MVITLPVYSVAPASGNYYTACHVDSVTGWTATSGYTWLTAHISGSGASDQIALMENGSGHTSIASPYTDWASTSSFIISCDFVGSYS